MDMSDATDEILSFAEKASNGTTLAYELRSYQAHPDYTKTLECCSVKPKPFPEIGEREQKILLTELIGLSTLEKWIAFNEFNLTL